MLFPVREFQSRRPSDPISLGHPSSLGQRRTTPVHSATIHFHPTWVYVFGLRQAQVYLHLVGVLPTSFDSVLQFSRIHVCTLRLSHIHFVLLAVHIYVGLREECLHIMPSRRNAFSPLLILCPTAHHSERPVADQLVE
jgi:hypothetical protein